MTTSRYCAWSPLGYTTGAVVATPATCVTVTWTPVSSNTSRTAVAAGSSPGSTMPAGTVHRPLSARRTRSSLPPSSVTTALTPGNQSGWTPIMSRRVRMKSGVGTALGYPREVTVGWGAVDGGRRPSRRRAAAVGVRPDLGLRGARHCGDVERLVELLERELAAVDVAEGEGRLANREALLDSLLGDRGRVLVADELVERRDDRRRRFR